MSYQETTTFAETNHPEIQDECTHQWILLRSSEEHDDGKIPLGGHTGVKTWTTRDHYHCSKCIGHKYIVTEWISD